MVDPEELAGAAAGLDPLGFDRLVPVLHRLNAARDAPGLSALLRDLLPPVAGVTARSEAERLAIMRDLGLLLGSLRACDAEPAEAVPGLTEVLLALGATSDMVPRDTLHHYVMCNPVGPRERTYTGDVMERMLVSSVRSSLPRVTSAARMCGDLLTLDPMTPDFVVAANEVVVRVRAVHDAIEATVATVTPVYFAGTLRQYFEPIHVAGKRYLGPAAAHMPLYLVDLALWAGDDDTLVYREFWRESAEYGLPEWRALAEQWAHGPSVTTRLVEAMGQHREDHSALDRLRASAEAVGRAQRGLVAFRGKHLTLAREAYEEGVGRFPTGSGGGTIDLLATVTNLSRENAALVNQVLRAAGGRRAHA
ncbi:monodechloroaminopyrrolnitrin synthase PrnB family protein [Lentzea sp. DG1S-22]|uniref:monodechloroaminopyrrolnitrin synthase PrnB family protein n=1 Tax=Lentzea sp. DG1S-22 TaxID=3108822 RepID=UPI002E77B71D|nr:monodechloroaminopyrrolnitrin synthase PrnB family protein [Lentzea sp. DG1S-22]WVH82423.1 monodechloroaminopyrrolnitrin synthase PrnB family protein [Lentzea sp. DG1S-22]